MRITVVILALVLAASVSANVCDPKAVLEAHLKKQGVPANALVLARDHKGAWVGGRWNGSAILADRAFANLHLSEPTVTMARNEDLRLFAVNTNPLMYSAIQTAGELVPRTDLADLQQIISLLANVGTSALRIQEQAQATETMNESIDRTDDDPLARIAADVIGAIETTDRAVAGKVEQVKIDAAAVSRLAAIADERNSTAEVFVLRVESGDAAPPRITVNEEERQLPSQLDEGFARLFRSRSALEQAPAIPCPGAVSAAAAAVDRKIIGGNELAALRDFRAKLIDMSGHLETCDRPLQLALSALRLWLAANEPRGSAATGDQLRILGNLHVALQSYGAIATARTEALTTSATAIGKRAAAVRTASAFLDLARRYQSHFDGDPCSLTAGVLEVRRFFLTNVDQPFTRDGKETFTISVDPRFAAGPARHPATLTSSYKVVARRSLDVDFDFGAVYTSLSDPTYGVVTHGTEQRIEETKTETRAGQVALFASFRMPRLDPVQLQVGAGVSSEDPAIYGGVAYQLSRYVKLSTGWTMQRVTRLGQGLRENDVVTDASQLRTRDAFAGAWYAAISITLDEIDFFRPSS